MTKISFVYFDVGGVILLDYSGTNKWEEMKLGLGVTPATDTQFEAIWDSQHNRICIDYDVELYVPQFRALGLLIPADYSMIADFVSRYEPNPHIWPIIEYVRKNYQTGLLTNMYPKLLAAIYARQELRTDWGWEIIIDSSVVKAQKPEPKIFAIAESKVSCPPSEILFVENSREHIEAAKSRGWQTFLYDSHDYVQSSQDLFNMLQNSVN
ncbi:MAG: HAD-IA family hydrolase [bacterium]